MTEMNKLVLLYMKSQKKKKLSYVKKETQLC